MATSDVTYHDANCQEPYCSVVLVNRSRELETIATLLAKRSLLDRKGELCSELTENDMMSLIASRRETVAARTNSLGNHPDTSIKDRHDAFVSSAMGRVKYSDPVA
jgi:hypothetical protein